jgi:hypothetical protein
MRGRTLYCVEWVDHRATPPVRRWKVFAQRRAAVVFMFTMRRLGATAEVASAPMPDWTIMRVTDRERDKLRTAITRSAKRRRAAREHARERFGR